MHDDELTLEATEDCGGPGWHQWICKDCHDAMHRELDEAMQAEPLLERKS